MALLHMLAVAYQTDSGLHGFCNPVTLTTEELSIPKVQLLLRLTESDLSIKYKSPTRCALISILPLTEVHSENLDVDKYTSSEL